MSCSSLVHSFLVGEIQFSIYHDRLGAFEFSLRPLFFPSIFLLGRIQFQTVKLLSLQIDER